MSGSELVGIQHGLGEVLGGTSWPMPLKIRCSYRPVDGDFCRDAKILKISEVQRMMIARELGL